MQLTVPITTPGIVKHTRTGQVIGAEVNGGFPLELHKAEVQTFTYPSGLSIMFQA
jgi:hypothetical protein